MSGRTAAALCLAAFFATAGPLPVWEWMNTTWSVLVDAVEEPEIRPGGGDDGWLIDPNG
jgi:hypothetical protein